MWVARSDTQIRGPVELSLLFPALPDMAWDAIFTRDTTINFVSGASTWLYDVSSDRITGPSKVEQPPLFTKGPVAQISDGRIAAFPREEFFGSDQSYMYMLNRTTGQVPVSKKRLYKLVECKYRILFSSFRSYRVILAH